MTEIGLQRLPVDAIDTSETFLRPVDTNSVGYLQLMDMIASDGVKQSILVRLKDDGLYYLIDGHHRLTCSKELGILEIPCLIVECTDKEALALQMKLNLRPLDTPPAAFAMQLKRIIDLDPEITEIQLAEQTSTTVFFIKERLKLINLSEEVQKLVDNGEITIGNAVELTRHYNPSEEVIEAAKKMGKAQFTEYLNYHIKKARVNSFAKKRVEYKPHPAFRKLQLLLEEIKKPNEILKLAAECSTVEEAYAEGIRYSLSLDKHTYANRVEEFNRREQEEEQQRLERRKERLRTQLSELEGLKNNVTDSN